MILRIRNIDNPSDIVLTEGVNTINLNKAKDIGVQAEIEPGKEYQIIPQPAKEKNIILRFFLWFVFSIFDLIGMKNTNCYTDILGFNPTLKDTYISVLKVKDSAESVDTVLLDHVQMLPSVVLCFDGRNNVNASIKYFRNYDIKALRNKYKKWIIANSVIMIIWELVLVSAAIIGAIYGRDNYIIGVYTVIMMLLSITIPVRFLAALQRNNHLFLKLISFENLDEDVSYKNDSKNKAVFLKNDTANDLIIRVYDCDLQLRKFYLFAGSNKRILVPEHISRIRLESYETNDIGQPGLKNYLYLLLNYVLFNCHVADLLSFENYIHGKYVDNCYLELGKEESGFVYHIGEKAVCRCWSSKKRTQAVVHLESNIPDIKKDYKYWKNAIASLVMPCLIIAIILTLICFCFIAKWIGVILLAVCTFDFVLIVKLFYNAGCTYDKYKKYVVE